MDLGLETMVFEKTAKSKSAPTGERAVEQLTRHYRTKQEALRGHEQIVEQLRARYEDDELGGVVMNASEAARDVEGSPLPFALVRTARGDVAPVLLGDSGDDQLTGVSILGDLVSLAPRDIVGAVSVEPSAVFYGVHAELQSESLQMAAEEDIPEATRLKLQAKRGDVIKKYPGLQVRKGQSFKVRPRGARFQWTPEKPQGLSAFPEVKPVLLRQRASVPTLDTIRMAIIFAGLTVHAGTEEAEETFTMLLQRYESMHGAMPPVEMIQDILQRHLPTARGLMYETAMPWSVATQEALKRGLRDRELRRYLWIDLPLEDQVESVGLAKMSFALMLLGQNVCCADTWILGAMFAEKPFDTSDPQAAAIRRRAAAEDISGQWKWAKAASTRELGLRRYEQIEDALVSGNPWHDRDPGNPLSRAQTQWVSWEWALGVPASHRPWLEITKKLQGAPAHQSDAPF